MPFNEDNLYWTKKGGERIKISDMSNSHLLNTLRMLETETTSEEGTPVPAKKHPKYNILKLNALSRNII